MAISVTCVCGQRFAAPDEFAGKKGKCPKCGQPLSIPGTPSEAEPAAWAGGIGDLLDEAGLGEAPTGYACPECQAPLSEDAILCVNCGYHLQKGAVLATKHIGPKKLEYDPTRQILSDAKRELDAEKKTRLSFSARRRAGREKAQGVVNSGLKTVYYSIVCELFIYLGGVLVACMGAGAGGGAILVYMVFPGLASVVLAIIGRANCLFSTPDGSGRGFIMAWFVLIPLSVIGQLVYTTNPEIGLMIKHTLYYGGVVCWKLYLWRFSRFIGRNDIATFALGLAIFQAAAIGILTFYVVSQVGGELNPNNPAGFMAIVGVLLAYLIEEILVAIAHLILIAQLTD